MTNYAVGDIIEQHCFGQPEHARPVIVEQRYPDIKNGRPGFQGHIVGSSDGVWGYDSDVHRVLWPRNDRA